MISLRKYTDKSQKGRKYLLSICDKAFFFKKMILFIFIFGCAGSSLLCSFSLLVESKGCAGFSPRGPPLVAEQHCGPRALESGATVVVHWPSYSTAMDSSQTRDRTHVSCSGKQILYHRATSL